MRRGVILIIVLVVIVLMTLSVYAFSKFMLAERRGTKTFVRQTQVRLFAESGVEYLRMLLMKDSLSRLEIGGIYDNEYNLCGHIVVPNDFDIGTSNADSTDIGRFSVVSPLLSSDGTCTGIYAPGSGAVPVRYGLEDESSKCNLRWVLEMDTQQPGTGRELLMRLPGVTEYIADAILDWIDADSEPREYGCEDEYYSKLEPPYYTRNGLPDSLDELLLVRGVTPKLLYGIDWNRNGVVDIGEPDESVLDEFEVTDGSLNLGLIAFLTLDSRESIYSPEGLPKINVNMEDTEELRTQLVERFDNEEWADYIVQYRQGGAESASTAESKINSLLDFVGGQGSPFADTPDAMNADLPLLYDNLMLSDTPVIGRININQASRSVLNLLLAQNTNTVLSAEDSLLQQLDLADMIDGIIAERVSDPYLIEQPEMNYPFWIYTHGIVADLNTMKQLEPYFTCQGSVYKANVIGRFDEKSPVARLEVWLDASESHYAYDDNDVTVPVKILRKRDISALGPGYSLEVLLPVNELQR